MDPGGATAGILRKGDVLLEVNRKRVTDLGEMDRALADGAGASVLLQLQRGDVQVYVVVSTK